MIRRALRRKKEEAEEEEEEEWVGATCAGRQLMM
jgi:hypothetical protein